MKRLICLLLALLMLLPLAACASKRPSGYHLVSLEKDPFDLYVPGTWRDNSASSISSAYYSNDQKIMVSAVAYENTRSETLLAFVTRIESEYAERLDRYEKSGEITETTLGGNAAYRLEYFTVIEPSNEYADETLMKFCSIFAIYDKYVVNLTYCAASTYYADRMEDFENIMAYFTFREPVIAPPVQGEDGEEYVLASNEKHVYKFYVPSTWTVLTGSEIPGAYRFSNDGDRSNVSLMEYVLSTEITDAETYWEYFKQHHQDPLEVISIDKNAKLGKYNAFSAEYTTVTNGETYHIKQVFLATSDVIYIFTYTSSEAFYAKHLDDVAKMVEMFEFK